MSDEGGDHVANEQMKWFIYFIVLAVVSAWILILVGSGLERSTNTSGATLMLLSDRLLLDQDCYAYREDSRNYFGVVDKKKFDGNSNCFTRDGFSAKITLKLEGSEKMVYNNEGEYLVNSKICPMDKERYLCKKFSRAVAVNDGQNTMLGEVEIDAVIENA